MVVYMFEAFLFRKFGLGTHCLALFVILDQHIIHASRGVKPSNHERNGKTSDTHELNRNTKHEYILKVLKVALK